MNENNQIVPIIPIPYLYDAKNPDPRQVAILEQVKAYCDIPDTQADADTWAYIWQAVRRLSLITCWAEKNDDTLLLQHRTQVYSVKQENACCRGCCCCDEDLVKVPLAYEPVPEKGYISGKISVRINGREVTEVIPQDYLFEHTDWETGTLYIDRADFPNTLLYKNSCCCLCNRDARITLKYNAGYEAIPVGMLPAVCEMIKKIDTDTSDVCATATTKVSGLLKRKKVGNVEYEWDTNNKKVYDTDILFTELNNMGLLGEVMVYNRCAIAEVETKTGEVV